MMEYGEIARGILAVVLVMCIVFVVLMIATPNGNISNFCKDAGYDGGRMDNDEFRSINNIECYRIVRVTTCYCSSVEFDTNHIDGDSCDGTIYCITDNTTELRYFKGVKTK